LDNIEVDALLRCLVDGRVITENERINIKSDGWKISWISPHRPVQKLLYFISKKSSQNFLHFLSALDATGQREVSTFLKDKTGKNNKFKNNKL